MLSLFPRDVLDEILNLTESVSEGFLPNLLPATPGTKHQRRTFWLCKGNAKVGKDAQADWRDAIEILGKERCWKMTWATRDVLDLYNDRRDLKKKRYEAEETNEYREANKRIQRH